MSTKTTTPKQSEFLNALYPIADALQMNMMFHDKDGEYFLHGSMELEIPVTAGFGIEIHCKVKAHCYDAKVSEVSALVHVSGNLWVYVTHFGTTKRVYFTILDGGKINLATGIEKLKGLSCSQMAKILAPGVVSMYHRPVTSKEWVNDEVNSVVTGQQPPVKQFSWLDDPGIGVTA